MLFMFQRNQNIHELGQFNMSLVQQLMSNVLETLVALIQGSVRFRLRKTIVYADDGFSYRLRSAR